MTDTFLEPMDSQDRGDKLVEDLIDEERESGLPRGETLENFIARKLDERKELRGTYRG